MSNAPICKLCRQRPATVPDRNRTASVRFRREVCSDCHAERLRGDLLAIIDHERRRAASAKEGE